jgi:hypothetical protein
MEMLASRTILVGMSDSAEADGDPSPVLAGAGVRRDVIGGDRGTGILSARLTTSAGTGQMASHVSDHGPEGSSLRGAAQSRAQRRQSRQAPQPVLVAARPDSR